MDRRKFIKNTAVIGSAAMCKPSLVSILKNQNFKMGYQLYSIRDKMATDPLKTLQKLTQAGYSEYEIYGYKPSENSIYGFKPTELKSILDDLNVTVSSGHYGFSEYLTQSDDALSRFVDSCIVAAKKLDSKYITWPWLAPEMRNMDHYRLMPDKLNKIGEQINQAGLAFAYHNHGFEFEGQNGRNAYDLIMKQTDPDLVKLQMDMYWVMHSSNLTPKQLVNAQPGRFVMWHIKDMDKVTRDYTELGNGSIDYTTLLPDPKKSGLEHFYIEQGGNYAHDSMQSALDSAAYFKTNLQDQI